MPSVTYDGVQIVNTTYVPRFVRHESAPSRDLSLLALAREDGSILVAEKYGTKSILIAGNIKASSQTNLETAIDVFKELFSRKAKDLNISWAGGTRTYEATCVNHIFNRDYMHINFCPWSAEFVVPSGISEGISETTLVSGDTFTAATDTGTWTFAGSAKPKPRIRIKCDAGATDPKGIEFKNTDTGESLVLTNSGGFVAGEYFEIDCRLKTAKYNSVEQVFFGVYPTFIVGANAYELKVGNIENQSFDSIANFDGAFNIYDDGAPGSELRIAQSFSVPYTNDTFQGIEVYVKKTGAPPQNLNWSIYNDSGNAPDILNIVTNGNGGIASGDVGAGYSWVTNNSTNAFTLIGGTKYWLDLRQSGGAAGNSYQWRYADAGNAIYKRGNVSVSDDVGATWTDNPTKDVFFRILYGGKADAAKTYEFDVYYYKRYL